MNYLSIYGIAAVFTLFWAVAIATPPSCILACIDADNICDFGTSCKSDSIQKCLSSNCPEAVFDEAATYFQSTCQKAGNQVVLAASPTNSGSSSSKALSSSAQSGTSALPSSTQSTSVGNKVTGSLLLFTVLSVAVGGLHIMQ
ncbi:hypothetical protein EDC01DRAFT_365531 [Geopyxis carbonaria]|nr:hypothetical protein EDC01DRAFT_365531 [Geopyxis carbonaria]